MISRNNENGMAYQSKVVSTWGVILSKIAYRNGFELDIDSPWVPKEWLPIQPLDEYECPAELGFVKEFDLFTPFKKAPPILKTPWTSHPFIQNKNNLISGNGLKERIGNIHK
jgi:hypothetical protein